MLVKRLASPVAHDFWIAFISSLTKCLLGICSGGSEQRGLELNQQGQDLCPPYSAFLGVGSSDNKINRIKEGNHVPCLEVP